MSDQLKIDLRDRIGRNLHRKKKEQLDLQTGISCDSGSENEAIQKSRVIFKYSTTTLMKGPTRENIDLDGRIGHNLFPKKTSETRPSNGDITCFW